MKDPHRTRRLCLQSPAGRFSDPKATASSNSPAAVALMVPSQPEISTGMVYGGGNAGASASSPFGMSMTWPREQAEAGQHAQPGGRSDRDKTRKRGEVKDE